MILDCIPCVMVIFLSTRQAKPIYRPLRDMRIDKMPDLDLGIWPWPLTLAWVFDLDLISSEKMLRHDLSQFDLDLWPTTSTYNPNLAKVKVDSHAKNQGHM